MNVFRLKYTVAAKDPDLASLRAWRGFPELASSLTGAGAAAGDAALPGAVTAKLRAEAKSPFRLLRLFLFGGLFGGAAIAALVTLPALLKAALSLSSDDGAAEALRTSALNAAVDAAVLAGAGWAAKRELDAKAAAEDVAEREETLGLLRVLTGGASRSGASAASSTTLASLRGRYRPLLLVGSRAHMRGCARAAEPYIRELRARGVLIVTLQEDEAREAAAPKAKGFGAPNVAAPAAGAGAGPSDAFSGGAESGRWRADVFDVPAWRAWAQQAREQAKLGAAEPFYVALALDGTVRRSAAGAPKWCVHDALLLCCSWDLHASFCTLQGGHCG